ncbi:DNA topoisomerase IV [Flavobacterium sp. MFBS3-15]|uniref:DNA topoisomerase IV n=1 Tax=Flavobacterium sp. MFBS3-15 TaxID=2989816 RepID=UPI0022359C96|nr:DNA topoisomerase IV [Flavobacterium sp. MFBS3-15]MCW4467800.1 DNA topoisomerase IV [Flavobacterium sp. MFBS3-15]
MKKLAYLLFAGLLLTACYQQERNCADFKTGKFRAEFEVDGKKHVSEFERTENLEIETVNGKVDSTAIRWVNECEYIGTKVNPKNMQEQKAVQIKILTTKDDSYTFEFSLVGDTQKQKGIVTRVE